MSSTASESNQVHLKMSAPKHVEGKAHHKARCLSRYEDLLYFGMVNYSVRRHAIAILRSYTGSGRKAKDNNLFWMMSSEMQNTHSLLYLSDYLTGSP